MVYKNFYVITGGPGAGKTTLLNALESSGFSMVPEVARAIIKEQMTHNGTALPWKDQRLYTRLMLERSVESYRQTCAAASQCSSCLYFFDRGIPDALCYATITGIGISPQMDALAKACPYNRTVFLLPPWKAIYTTDGERKQSWEEAVFTYEQMKQLYTRYHYDVIDVPTGSIGSRKAFILEMISG